MDMNNLKSMMSSFMENAQKLQENMKDKVVTGRAGGDLVVVDANLKMQITRLELAPALFEEKPEVITELVMGAVNQALQNAQQMLKQEIGGKFGL